jgi:predicted amidohydrolase YtcJ
MLPGFVDSHGHVVFGGLQALSANLLAPPDGEVTDIASLQETLRRWIADNAEAVERVNMSWVSAMTTRNSPSCAIRRATTSMRVSTDYPIVIVHQSGHIGVANSRALEVAGVDRGHRGAARRRLSSATPDGAPNGVVEEYAFFPLLMKNLAGLGPEALHDVQPRRRGTLGEIRLHDGAGRAVLRRDRPGLARRRRGRRSAHRRRVLPGRAGGAGLISRRHVDGVRAIACGSAAAS